MIEKVLNKGGVSPIEKLEDLDAPTITKQKISSAASLTDLIKEYVFFTHAPLLLYAGSSVDPLITYIQTNTGCELPFMLEMPNAAFSNLKQFDNILFGISHKWWSKVAYSISIFTTINRKRREYCRPLCQRIPVVDALALSKTSVVPIPTPSVEIYTFGIDANICTGHFVPPLSLTPTSIIEFKFDTPLPETILLAKEMFDPNPNFNTLNHLTK